MKVSLVISDVDATLITPEHEITDRTLRSVKELQRRGIGFTIASSRPPRGLRHFVKKLKLTEPFAAFNGAVIQLPSGETLLKHTLSRKICEQAFEITEQLGIDLWIYCDHDWYVGRMTSFVEREQNSIGFKAIVEKDLRSAFGTAAKIVMVGEPAIVSEAELMVGKTFGAEVSATKSKPRFLDITDKNAHKGAVVTELCGVLWVPASETVVIGDGLNDVLMFEKAGFSIAMGQSSEAVKKAAKALTKPNTEEGFAHAMETFVLHPNTESNIN